MRSATLIGSSLVVLALVGVEVGCRSNNGTGGTGAGGAGTTTSTSKATTGTTMTTGTTGTTNPTTTTTVTGTTTTGTASTTSSTGTAGGCKSPLATPHPPGTAPTTLFCPFGNATNMDYCDPSTQQCCETPMNTTPTMCASNTTPCAMLGGASYMAWGCAGAIDCTGTKKVCCTNAGTTIEQNMVNGVPCPGDFFASHMYQTTCVADTTACANQPAFTYDSNGTMKTLPAGPGVQMCTTDNDCTAPKKCLAFRKAGADVGACQ